MQEFIKANDVQHKVTILPDDMSDMSVEQLVGPVSKYLLLILQKRMKCWTSVIYIWFFSLLCFISFSNISLLLLLWLIYTVDYIQLFIFLQYFRPLSPSASLSLQPPYSHGTRSTAGTWPTAAYISWPQEPTEYQVLLRSGAWQYSTVICGRSGLHCTSVMGLKWIYLIRCVYNIVFLDFFFTFIYIAEDKKQ